MLPHGGSTLTVSSLTSHHTWLDSGIIQGLSTCCRERRPSRGYPGQKWSIGVVKSAVVVITVLTTDCVCARGVLARARLRAGAASRPSPWRPPRRRRPGWRARTRTCTETIRVTIRVISASLYPEGVPEPADISGRDKERERERERGERERERERERRDESEARGRKRESGAWGKRGSEASPGKRA